VSTLIPARPNRDSSTWAGYFTITTYSWFLYGFSATQALIRDEQNTSRTVASFHAILLALGGVVAGLLAAKLILTFGRGRFLTIALFGTIAGILIYTAPGGFPVTMTGAFLASYFGSSTVIGATAFLFDYQKGAGPAAITEANALAALAGVLAPLAIGLGSVLIVGWRVGLWIMFIGILISLLLMRRNPLVFRVPPDEQARESSRQPFPKLFWWSLVTLALFLGTEFTLTIWSADLLRDRGGFEAGAAAASVAAVTGGILIGRTLGARFAEYFPVDRILKFAVLTTVLGWSIVWLSTTGAVMLLGLLISGIGVSVFWPIGVSRVVLASGGQSDRATAYSAVAGSTAVGLGPLLLGSLADSVGVHSAFIVLPVFVLVGLLLMIIKPVTRAIPPATPSTTGV
jgi:predicted MFS family arabinose efflux permease